MDNNINNFNYEYNFIQIYKKSQDEYNKIHNHYQFINSLYQKTTKEFIEYDLKYKEICKNIEYVSENDKNYYDYMYEIKSKEVFVVTQNHDQLKKTYDQKKNIYEYYKKINNILDNKYEKLIPLFKTNSSNMKLWEKYFFHAFDLMIKSNEFKNIVLQHSSFPIINENIDFIVTKNPYVSEYNNKNTYTIFNGYLSLPPGKQTNTHFTVEYKFDIKNIHTETINIEIYEVTSSTNGFVYSVENIFFDFKNIIKIILYNKFIEKKSKINNIKPDIEHNIETFIDNKIISMLNI